MGKLHELLAVEESLAGAAKKIVAEALVTFTKKADHFQGYVKRYEPFVAGVENERPSEEKAMVTTVRDKLVYTFDAVVPWLDAVLQKEATNQQARADIIVGDDVLATDVPATYLLGLETKLKELREMAEGIPTLQPGIVWEPDPSHEGSGVFKTAHPIERLRTEKVVKPVVLYPHTDKHPAQVKEVTEDVNVGKFIDTHWSGMYTPAQKSELLGRIDTLLRAVKQARQRANCAEVVTSTIGDTLKQFIIGE